MYTTIKCYNGVNSGIPSHALQLFDLPVETR